MSVLESLPVNAQEQGSQTATRATGLDSSTSSRVSGDHQSV